MEQDIETRSGGNEDARPVAIRIGRRGALWCVDIVTVAGTAKLGGAPNHRTAVAFAERQAARLQVPLRCSRALLDLIDEVGR